MPVIKKEDLQGALVDLLGIMERQHETRGMKREQRMAGECRAAVQAVLKDSRGDLKAALQRYLAHNVTSDPGGLEQLPEHYAPEVLEEGIWR